MIAAFASTIRRYDADVVVGFNDLRFDFPYLYQRAAELGVVTELCDWSRVPGHHAAMLNVQKWSMARGKHTVTSFDCPGRVSQRCMPPKMTDV